MPGDIKYRDVNGDGRNYTEEDQVMLSSYGGDCPVSNTYGFGVSLMYKRVDFSVFFNGLRQNAA